MFRELPQKGIGQYTFAPPVYRLLWKIGVKIPPPLFSSSEFIFLFQGLFFGSLWGIFMRLTVWQDMNTIIFIIRSILAGSIFGLSMAILLRRKAKKYGLPRWKDYGKEG